MKKKVIIVVGIIVVVILSIGIYMMYNQEIHKTQGGAIKENKIITIESPKNTKYLYLTLGLDNSNCQNQVKYVLKNPHGKSMMEGSVNGKDILLDNTYAIEGKKGQWTLELIKEKEEELCNFNMTTIFSNKKK